jgi:hypothetical protein
MPSPAYAQPMPGPDHTRIIPYSPQFMPCHGHAKTSPYPAEPITTPCPANTMPMPVPCPEQFMASQLLARQTQPSPSSEYAQTMFWPTHNQNPLPVNHMPSSFPAKPMPKTTNAQRSWAQLMPSLTHTQTSCSAQLISSPSHSQPMHSKTCQARAQHILYHAQTPVYTSPYPSQHNVGQAQYVLPSTMPSPAVVLNMSSTAHDQRSPCLAQPMTHPAPTQTSPCTAQNHFRPFTAHPKSIATHISPAHAHPWNPAQPMCSPWNF